MLVLLVQKTYFQIHWLIGSSWSSMVHRQPIYFCVDIKVVGFPSFSVHIEVRLWNHRWWTRHLVCYGNSDFVQCCALRNSLLPSGAFVGVHVHQAASEPPWIPVSGLVAASLGWDGLQECRLRSRARGSSPACAVSSGLCCIPSLSLGFHISTTGVSNS